MGELKAARGVRLYCLAAGTLDTVTGLLLVFAPRLALAAMGVAEPPTDLVLLRWIGAFVAATGSTYLYPFVLAPGWRAQRLAIALEITVLPRLAVFAFTTAALALGWLASAWISVPATDLGLAAVQLGMISAGWTRQ